MANKFLVFVGVAAVVAAGEMRTVSAKRKTKNAKKTPKRLTGMGSSSCKISPPSSCGDELDPVICCGDDSGPVSLDSVPAGGSCIIGTVTPGGSGCDSGDFAIIFWMRCGAKGLFRNTSSWELMDLKNRARRCPLIANPYSTFRSADKTQKIQAHCQKNGYKGFGPALGHVTCIKATGKGSSDKELEHEEA